MAVDRREIEKVSREIGEIIKYAIGGKFGPSKVGFCLMLFDIGEAGSTAYIADGNREDVIKLIEQLVTTLKES